MQGLRERISFKAISIYIATPLIIAVVLFPFWEEIKLQRNDENTVIVTNKDFTKLSARTFIADILQLPFNLKWYEIHIQDTTDFGDNKGMQNISLQLDFEEGSPEKYSRTSLKEISENLFEFPIGGESSFTYLLNDEFTFRALIWFDLDRAIQNRPTVIWPSFEIYAKPLLEGLIVKYIIVIILWLILVSTFLNIWNKIYRKKL